MKKIYIFLAGCLATTGIFYSCKMLDALKTVENSGFKCSNYSGLPFNQMNKQAVIDMIRNYYQNQYTILHNLNSTNNNRKLILPAECPVDSRAVFFSLDTLKKLIYFIEKGSENFSYNDKKDLGVNFYFASYPAGLKRYKHGYPYSNRHTLVMLPSIFDSGTKMAKDIDLSRNLVYGETAPAFLSEGFLLGPQLFIFGAGEVYGNDQANSQSMTSQNNTTGTPPPAPANNTGNPLLDITDPQ